MEVNDIGEFKVTEEKINEEVSVASNDGFLVSVLHSTAAHLAASKKNTHHIPVVKLNNRSYNQIIHTNTHTHTHTCLTTLCPELPGWAYTRKVKPIWILLQQETASGSGISWAICTSAPRSRQITMPAPHSSVFYRPDALPAAQPTASKH